MLQFCLFGLLACEWQEDLVTSCDSFIDVKGMQNNGPH